MSITKEKFTAGSWVKTTVTGTPEKSKIVNKQGLIIATIGPDETGRMTDEEVQANAQLISAAPDMFNFIREMYEHAKNNQAIYPALEKTYNKALGVNA